MNKPVEILLQTTIPYVEDDWSIERFSMLQDHLKSLKDNNGNPLCKVTARNCETDGAGNDVVMSVLDSTDFDQLWIFAVDTGDGLTKADCEESHVFIKEAAGFWRLAITTALKKKHNHRRMTQIRVSVACSSSTLPSTDQLE